MSNGGSGSLVLPVAASDLILSPSQWSSHVVGKLCMQSVSVQFTWVYLDVYAVHFQTKNLQACSCHRFSLLLLKSGLSLFIFIISTIRLLVLFIISTHVKKKVNVI